MSDDFLLKLNPNERIDDLQRNNLKIIQNDEWFCFGMDAVLLSEFAKANEGDVCLDLCAGNGIVSLLMSGRYDAKKYVGLEIQPDVVQMANRSIELNKLTDKVSMLSGDVREATSLFEAASFDVITCNPPYLTEHHGLVNPSEHKAIARHELLCSLDDVLNATSKLLKPRGHFFMVHRPFRLAQIISLMVEKKLEPKTMRLVYPYKDKEPNMVLIEGVRGGNQRLKVEKPLIVYEEKNRYTKELLDIYYS